MEEWDEKKWSKKYPGDKEELYDAAEIKKRIVKLVLQPIPKIKSEEIEWAFRDMDHIRVSTEWKTKFYKFIQENAIDKARNLRTSMIYEIFAPDAVLERNICYRREIKEWMAAMQDELIPGLEEFDDDEAEKILALLAFEKNRMEGKHEYEELITNLLIFIDRERGRMK